MSEKNELLDQLKQMESKIQRMRFAIIVIAAFFVYEALGPLPFGRERVDIQQKIKARELFIVDGRGETIAYLGADDAGAGLFLDDAAGNRLDARPAAISLMTLRGDQRVNRLKVKENGVEIYDGSGRISDVFP